MEFSASRLKLFESCPGAFALKYLHGVVEEDNEPARVGRDVHALIDVVLAEQAGQKPERGYADINPSQEALDLFGVWKEMYLPEVDPKNTLDREKKITLTLGPHTLVVVMDLIESIGGFLTVTDWKLTYKMLTGDEMKKDIQTRAYVVAAFALYPTFDEMVFQHRNPRLRATQHLELTKNEAEAWAESLKDLMQFVEVRVKAYEKGEKAALPFTPGAPCLTCGFATSCDARNKALKAIKPAKGKVSSGLEIAKLEQPGTLNSAFGMAAKILFAKAWVAAAQKVLKKWVDAKGSIEMNGGVFGYHPSVTQWVDTGMIPFEADDPKQQARLDELHNQLKPFMVLDDSKSSKLWKNEGLVNRLRELGAVKEKSRVEFKFKKTKDDGEAQSD